MGVSEVDSFISACSRAFHAFYLEPKESAMSEKFEKCEELGLKPEYITYTPLAPSGSLGPSAPRSDFFIRASLFEKLLGEGVEVFGRTKDDVAWIKFKDVVDKYRALVVGIKPIEQDSAEKFLKDLIKYCDGGPGGIDSNARELYDRAKRLTGGGK